MVCACFLVLLVVADVEGVLDDEADYLRREVGEMRGERCGEGVEVGALVGFEAARGHHFLDVRVGRLRGGRGAGAEETPFASSRRNAATSPLRTASCMGPFGMLLRDDETACTACTAPI